MLGCTAGGPAISFKSSIVCVVCLPKWSEKLAIRRERKLGAAAPYMAWRRELIQTSEGAADSAWEEDSQVAHVSDFTKSGASLRKHAVPKSNQRGGLSNEARGSAEQLSHSRQWEVVLAASSLRAEKRAHEVEVGAHFHGAKSDEEKELGASSPLCVSFEGPEMKRKEELPASVGEMVSQSCKRAQKQAGAALLPSKLSPIVPLRDVKMAVGETAMEAQTSSALPDMPALDVASSEFQSSHLRPHSWPSTPDKAMEVRPPTFPPSLQHPSDSTADNPVHQIGAPEAPSKQCLTELPPALLLEVLSHLKAHDLSIVACVCRLFRVLAGESQGWKNFYCERWRPAWALHGPPAEGTGERLVCSAWLVVSIQWDHVSLQWLGVAQ